MLEVCSVWMRCAVLRVKERWSELCASEELPTAKLRVNRLPGAHQHTCSRTPLKTLPSLILTLERPSAIAGTECILPIASQYPSSCLEDMIQGSVLEPE